MRKNGISLLVPTQNAEQTIELCIRSFVEYPDEIIVVDNGSTDDTVNILQRLEAEIDKMKFYNVPDLPDLYHNRQYAFEKSQYKWITRIDSDYVAYTSGTNDIRNLREFILNSPRSFKPIAYGIKQVNLFNNVKFTGKTERDDKDGPGKWVQPPISTLPARIIRCYPGMRFQRLGRWEGVRFQGRLKHIQIDKPYWFHCTFKDKIVWFYRSERTNWREHGDFVTYPTLESYIHSIIEDKYGTNDFDIASNIFYKNQIEPYLMAYNPEAYYPYPDLLLNVDKHAICS